MTVSALDPQRLSQKQCSKDSETIVVVEVEQKDSERNSFGKGNDAPSLEALARPMKMKRPYSRRPSKKPFRAMETSTPLIATSFAETYTRCGFDGWSDDHVIGVRRGASKQRTGLASTRL